MKHDQENGPWALIRRMYGVPARRGMRVTFRWRPVSGYLSFCNGQYLWLKTDSDEKIGPIHPTDLDYGDGHDYFATINAVTKIRNEWLNGSLSGPEAAACIAAVRSGEVAQATD